MSNIGPFDPFDLDKDGALNFAEKTLRNEYLSGKDDKDDNKDSDSDEG